MNGFYSVILAALILLLLVGLIRVVRGPTAADRMLAAQLFGTQGVALLLILSMLPDQEAARDVALVLALLAAVSGIAFTRRAWPAGGNDERE